MERELVDWLEREREKLKVRLRTTTSVEVRAWLRRELSSISAKIMEQPPKEVT